MPNHKIFAPVFHGEAAAVKLLLDGDATLVTIRDAKNLTPLHVAASRGQDAVVQLLIDYGADVNGPTDAGDWTPLVWAAYRGHTDAVKVLAENGAGITFADGNPIHFAGQRKHKDVCRILVEFGAVDGLVASGDEDLLSLFRAAYSYDTAGVQDVLVRRRKLIDATDKDGRTVLHESCAHGDTKTVRSLLEAGADVTLQDLHGQTPLDRASKHRQHAVMRLLKRFQGQ